MKPVIFYGLDSVCTFAVKLLLSYMHFITIVEIKGNCKNSTEWKKSV